MLHEASCKNRKNELVSTQSPKGKTMFYCNYTFCDFFGKMRT